MNKILSHDELQKIEHTNKVLKDHLELVQVCTKDSDRMIGDYTANIRGYINILVEIRTQLGNEVKHVINSTRELGIVISNTQNIHNFCSAIGKLDKLLTPELIEKLNRLR